MRARILAIAGASGGHIWKAKMRYGAPGRVKVVMRSVEDAEGQRCVDLIRSGRGSGASWAWVECRRDPEDGSGWRRLGVPVGSYGTERAADAAARREIGWMTEGSR